MAAGRTPDWENIDDWDELIAMEEDEEEDSATSNKNKSMKNVFIDTNIKKQKFSPEIVEKFKTSGFKFKSITPFMDIEGGNEGYLRAYSEEDFHAYRFRKIHDFYPDIFRLSYVNAEKFISELFKYFDVPNDSYIKSYQDSRGEVAIISFLIAFETETGGILYLYLDDDTATFFYDKKHEKDKDGLLHLLIGLTKGLIHPKISKNKIYVVYQSQKGFEKTGFAVKKINVNLEENYNEGFEEVSAEIVKGLNDKKKTNLVILRGDPGTGKTTYIRYLTSKLKKNIIFIAPDMVSNITDPSFIPFLIKNSDAVLIIEDGETAVGKRDISGRTGAVSNILNLTDGLLSDCLNISIVVTLNTDSKDIDPALERKGRLLKSYNFDKLAIDKSQALLKKLGSTAKVDKPMSLADIYFHEQEDNGGGQTERRKVGF
jgi:hypothetical protein